MLRSFKTLSLVTKLFCHQIAPPTYRKRLFGTSRDFVGSCQSEPLGALKALPCMKIGPPGMPHTTPTTSLFQELSFQQGPFVSRSHKYDQLGRLDATKRSFGDHSSRYIGTIFRSKLYQHCMSHLDRGIIPSAKKQPSLGYGPRHRHGGNPGLRDGTCACQIERSSVSQLNLVDAAKP